MPLLILLYNVSWIIFSPFILLLLIFRIVRGKEDILRLFERFGIPSKGKSSKNIIWLHAASVGESKIALTLTKHIQKAHPHQRVLITTGTVTSAQIIRQNLNGMIIHQFIPLDNYISIWLFFKYWNPKIGILIEAELWPNLLYVGSQFCPLLLVNARMSDKSFDKWSKYKFIAEKLFSLFKNILCQSKNDTNKYLSLGAKNAIMVGNIKFASKKLPVDLHNLKSLQNKCKNREVFLAASTHKDDEEIIIRAHMTLRQKYPNLLTIIAPRHINRADNIANTASIYDLPFAIRSIKDPIKANTEIYIADTMGELGVFFSLAKATFIGGSFKQGGHSIIEPAYFNTVIIFGPDMTNCTEVAEEFLNYSAAYQIQDAKELIDTLDQVYSGKILPNKKKTELIIKNHDDIIPVYMEYIDKYMEKND